jgi:hypothetical protein
MIAWACRVVVVLVVERGDVEHCVAAASGDGAGVVISFEGERVLERFQPLRVGDIVEQVAAQAGSVVGGDTVECADGFFGWFALFHDRVGALGPQGAGVAGVVARQRGQFADQQLLMFAEQRFVAGRVQPFERREMRRPQRAVDGGVGELGVAVERRARRNQVPASRSDMRHVSRNQARIDTAPVSHHRPPAVTCATANANTAARRSCSASAHANSVGLRMTASPRSSTVVMLYSVHMFDHRVNTEPERFSRMVLTREG